MISSKTILIPDTSALNHLLDDPDSVHLVTGLKAGYFIRLTGDNFREIVATKNEERRQQLLTMCRQLLLAGEFALPYNWLLEGHIIHFHQNPQAYNWKLRSVRFRHAEMEIVHQEFLNDKVAREEREDARENAAVFESVFCDVRDEFQSLFEGGVERQPGNVQELVTLFQVPGGAFWGYGRGLYAKITGVAPDESTIRDFVQRCPPLNAIILALCTAQYERCIRDLSQGPSLRAGRLDMYCAAHLPYCDKFVTADEKQLRALREIAAIGNFATEIIHYGDFRRAMVPEILASVSAP
jgi:hypothetical protein